MARKSISISADFLKAFSEIPKAQQKKVREFVQQFQVHPEIPGGQHYEKLKNSDDSRLYSIRVNLNYRAIIARPSSDVYMLLWVDTHEKAYQWAERKWLKIHPNTGGIQILQMQQPAAPEQPGTAGQPGLFDEFPDEKLLALAVPEELLGKTRAIRTEDDLFKAEADYPQEAYAGLFMLACGYPYEQVLDEYSHTEGNTVDTQDFETALYNADTLSRFTVIEDSVELEALLNAPLEQWRVFLHPLQRKIVQKDASGPIRVLGGAGTGKTVVAIHRAKYLLEHLFPDENDRILFTTYTKNLAADIANALRKICTPEEMKRIDIVNLDSWTVNYLRHKNFKRQVVDYREDVRKGFWEKAFTLKPSDARFSDQFFFDEWEQVIQAQNLSTLAEYMKAPRTGRGHRLNRLDRKRLWPVWEEYRAQLLENNYCEIQDLYRDAEMLLRESPEKQYRAVIVDEAQDFSLQAFSMIRAILPEQRNDIFIVGDAHQRIYGHKMSLGKSGIKIIGRSKKLKVNYRTTDETYRFASSVLTGLSFDDLDGQEDLLGKCLSLTHGPWPTIQCYATFEEETKQIAKLLKDFEAHGTPLSSICISCRTGNLVKRYAEALSGEGIGYCILSTDTLPDERKQGVRLATMHRVKGLEYDYMILAGVNDQYLPLANLVSQQENETDKGNAIKREKSLFYVALTRARKAVFVTGYGKPSPFADPTAPDILQAFDLPS